MGFNSGFKGLNITFQIMTKTFFFRRPCLFGAFLCDVLASSESETRCAMRSCVWMRLLCNKSGDAESRPKMQLIKYAGHRMTDRGFHFLQRQGLSFLFAINFKQILGFIKPPLQWPLRALSVPNADHSPSPLTLSKWDYSQKYEV